MTWTHKIQIPKNKATVCTISWQNMFPKAHNKVLFWQLRSSFWLPHLLSSPSKKSSKVHLLHRRIHTWFLNNGWYRGFTHSSICCNILFVFSGTKVYITHGVINLHISVVSCHNDYINRHPELKYRQLIGQKSTDQKVASIMAILH